MKRILVISPHPDDESIGCGGTLRKHVEDGDSVEVIFLTSGENGGHGRDPSLTRRLREAEARRACVILGTRAVEFWGMRDGAVRAGRAAVERLRGKFASFGPDTVYVPHTEEMHPDHRAAARLVQRALAGVPKRGVLPRVLMFEVWTPLQKMDEIVEISPQMKIKLEAIRAYATQCEVVGFDEAVVGLNRYRGEMHSWPEGHYAEVFAELKP